MFLFRFMDLFSSTGLIITSCHTLTALVGSYLAELSHSEELFWQAVQLDMFYKKHLLCWQVDYHLKAGFSLCILFLMINTCSLLPAQPSLLSIIIRQSYRSDAARCDTVIESSVMSN